MTMKCFCKKLLNYFVFSDMLYNRNKRRCCWFCKSTCN